MTDDHLKMSWRKRNKSMGVGVGRGDSDILKTIVDALF